MSLRLELLADEVAAVPAGPTLAGAGAAGEEEPLVALAWEAALDGASEWRA